MSESGVILVTGAGGVGKTTIAASVAVAAAARGSRTLVVTVDPAQRLADALGVGELGNQPTQVAGVENLWGAMLDVAASWEAIVHRHADPEIGDRLLANPYFRAIADRFPAAQAYAAGEQMAEYVESHTWDLVVVDTPPAAGGIDFLLAPGQMRDLVGGRLLRWITGARLPGRRTIFNVAARPALRLADSVLGGPLLAEIADFFLDLRTLYDGMLVRSKSVERHLRQAQTAIVTNASPTPMWETLRFFTELPEGVVSPAVIVFNRELPHSWETIAAPVREAHISDDDWTALAANLDRWSAEAQHTAAARESLSARFGVPLASVPWMLDPPTDIESLATLAADADGLLEALLDVEDG